MSGIGRRGSLVLHNLKSTVQGQRRRSFATITQPTWQAEYPGAQQGYQRESSGSERGSTDVLQMALALMGLTLSTYCSHQLITQRSALSAQPMPDWTEQVQAAGQTEPIVIAMKAVE